MLARPEMMFTISEYFKLKIQTQTKTFIHCPISVDRAYLRCLGKLQERVPHTKTKKRVHINICPQTVFKVQLTMCWPQSFRFYLWGHLIMTLVFSPSVGIEQTLHQRIYDACPTICSHPGAF